MQKELPMPFIFCSDCSEVLQYPFILCSSLYSTAAKTLSMESSFSLLLFPFGLFVGLNIGGFWIKSLHFCSHLSSYLMSASVTGKQVSCLFLGSFLHAAYCICCHNLKSSIGTEIIHSVLLKYLEKNLSPAGALCCWSFTFLYIPHFCCVSVS